MSMIDVQHHPCPGGHVAHVWLNRPERRNAFDAEVIAQLDAAFRAVSQDPLARALVLGGHGKAFCAGADLRWMQATADYSWAENHSDAGRLADMLWSLASCPVPVVAQVQGDCYGGGVGLAAAADIVVAVPEATFSLSEARLGLIPATISPYVIRAIGERAARRYFTTAERFTADQARHVGLVHEVVPHEALESTVQALVAGIAANGPQAVRACKQLVRDMADVPLGPELRDQTARRIADVRASDEGREGMRAFLDKRPARWTMQG